MRIIRLIIFFAFIASCNNNTAKKDGRVIGLDANSVKGIILHADTTQCYNEHIPHVGRLLSDQLAFNKGYAALYVLKSSCSVCIGEFIDFIKIMHSTDLDIPIYALLADSHGITIEYYMGQMLSPIERALTNLFIFENIIALSDIESDDKNVILIYDNRIIDFIR